VTVRIHTTPGFDYLADVAIAYARTVAHGVASGLTEDHARAAIGHRLGQDAESGRATDWTLLCDHLTALAEEVARRNRSKHAEPAPDAAPIQAKHSSGFVIADQFGGYPR
jgi:hypothetical protein